MANYLDTLLEKISDPKLRADIQAELSARVASSQFGLVFERHLPEAVHLPSYPIRRGVTVQARSDLNGPLWNVTKVNQGEVQLSRLDGAATVKEVGAESDYVVVRRVADPIYPGLKSLDSISRGGSKPSHVVINAENFHALETLLYTHEGNVDVIYIDPPYNTGNADWAYNDRYVDGHDIFRHSKWLSFMERRLVLARRLLKPTGVLIVAIDDNEHHRLRMLMDQVFGEQNFVMNASWQGNIKSNARFSGGGVDYMLVYAASLEKLSDSGREWRDPKPGLHEILGAAQLIMTEAADTQSANKAFRAWWKALPKDSPWLRSSAYSNLDPAGRVFRTGPLDAPGGGGARYEVLHPNGRPVKVPGRGWGCSPETLQRWIDEGLVVFGKDETTLPSKKTFLDEVQGLALEPTFKSDRRGAAKHLADVLGAKDFPYPKDHEVLMRWLGAIAPQDGVILDFFAGSGTTLESVMKLNAADGGSRQAILVTNNELAADTSKKLTKQGYRDGDAEWEAEGVFEKVTKPRISTVLTGLRRDGSKYSEGLDENVEFFELTYEDRDLVALGRRFDAIAPMLWLKAGGIGPRITSKPTDSTWSMPLESRYGVLFDVAGSKAFLQALGESSHVRFAFIVTDSDSIFRGIASRMPSGVEPVMLYDGYLTAFENQGQESP